MIGDDVRRFGRIADEKAKKAAAVEPCGSLQGAGDTLVMMVVDDGVEGFPGFPKQETFV